MSSYSLLRRVNLHRNGCMRSAELGRRRRTSRVTHAYDVCRRYSGTFMEDSDVKHVADGICSATISNRYSIGDAPNGGYLMSLAISAARYTRYAVYVYIYIYIYTAIDRPV